jgi:V/A-type H+-transporting ATPase subunit K
MNSLLICLPVVFLVVSVALSIKAVKNGKKTRSAVATQLLAFMAVCVVTFAIPVIASAATTAEPTENTTTTQGITDIAAAAASANSKGLGFLAAALAVGIAGIGGGIAVAAASPAAIGATSEDPKAFGKAIIFVALGEGIALYGLLISILILQKI